MTHPPSRLCPSDLRRIVPCKYWALTILAASPRYAAFYPLRVPRTSALPAASFRSHLAVDTLAARLTLPLAGCVEDFHLQVRAPCRAHEEKRPDFAVRPFSFCPCRKCAYRTLPRRNRFTIASRTTAPSSETRKV